MKKNKLYMIIAMVTLICLLAVSALCNQIGSEENEAPTLKLDIAEGPIFSEEDNTCYYEIVAVTTGNPQPDMEFALDDNVSLLSPEKVKVVLNDKNDTYTLNATAANTEGSTTASINLSWGCQEEPVSTEEDEKEIAEDEEEETTEDEENTDQVQDNQGEISEGDLFPPELSIFIYEGPLYSAADDVCYYHIACELYGNPYPELTWSKDDSNRTLGWDKAQVNLKRGETYTLIATATNSEGTVTETLPLSWRCDEGEVVDNVDGGEGDGDDNESGPITITLSADPSRTGLLIFGSGTKAVVGDIFVGHMGGWDLDSMGYISFNIGDILGKEILSATLKIKFNEKYDPRDMFVNLRIGSVEYNNLDSNVQYLQAIPIARFDPGINNIDFSGETLLNELKSKINNNRSRIQFRIHYENSFFYEGGTSHGVGFGVSDAKLEVKYQD